MTTLITLLSEPMVLLLVACSTLYFLLGDQSEAIFLGISVLIVIGISFLQQRKAERALQALRSLSSPRALVIREGLEIRIPSSEVVPGDLIVLQEGDRVPADGKLISATHLFADESMITGESVPVRLTNGRVLSHTLIVKGYGLAKVTATGAQTQVGRIGKSVQPPRSDTTRLQQEIGRLVRTLGSAGIVFCVVIAVLFALTRNDWPGGILAGLAAAMAMIPEEFPVILTLFFAMGAWRLSKINALTRNLAAIENLGAVTALCVDKTGTLTLNKMTVKELSTVAHRSPLPAGPTHPLPEYFHQVLEFGALASRRNPFDPMEKAIHEALQAELSGTEHVHGDWELVREYPLSDELLAMSCVWSSKRNQDFVVAAKGSPEAILDLCHMSREETSAVKLEIERMAAAGLRVLGVAKANFQSPHLPEIQHDFDFNFIGLVGLEDPLRPDVRAAVETCRGAGIRVLMITGDYPSTALKIATEAGIDVAGGVLTGTELEKMSDLKLKSRLRSVNVFARTQPEQKLRIVNALKELGEIVAMTGDGINDAPSLKWADVGIAMGGRGTDVAREASDLVLLDDRFASIVNGVERGRIIFSNIRSAMGFIFAVHIPIAGLAFIPVLLNWPLILLPAHIAFLELIIDPACTLVFESRGQRANVMTRPPRRLDRPLFSIKEILQSSFAGLIVMAVLGIAAWWLIGQGRDPSTVRGIIFPALIFCDLGLIAIFAKQSVFKLPFVLIVSGVSIFWISIWQIGWLRSLFALPALDPASITFGLAAGVLATGLAYLWNRTQGRVGTS